MVDLPCDEHRNRHILFRKAFHYDSSIDSARIYISADDYYKLYINGQFVAQGPAPSYHFNYNYNIVDVTPYLKKGENLIAVHTLYQGLINRVWQSGDNRHGLILDLVIDGETTEHISLVGNSFVYGRGLCSDKKFQQNFLSSKKAYTTRPIHT